MKLLNSVICYCTLLLIIGSFSYGCILFSETQIDAASAYESKQYITASELLSKDYQLEKDLRKKSDLAYKIAECYRLANRTKDAEEWYKKAMDYSTDPTVTFKYALSLKNNGNYKKAIQLFKEYALNSPGDRLRATQQMQACRQALSWQKNPSDHKVINLRSINTKFSDFGPTLYQQNQLVFTSSRKEALGEKLYGWTGEKHSDLFSSDIKGDFDYSSPIAFGDSINTKYNEGTSSFTSDFKEVYFTACGSANKIDDYCQIYHTKKSNNGWLLPEPVLLFEEDTFNVGHPFITADGKQLYFSSDIPGGYGSKDLYVATKGADGFWGEPTNLGPEINTERYEGFPSIGTDGWMYFASDGHSGMGGLDIFKAEKKGKRWGNPTNMQAPINSPADDFGFSFQGYVPPALIDSLDMMGYFSSSREGGKGNDDIYMFALLTEKEIPEPAPDTPAVTLVPNTPPPPPEPKIIYVLKGTVNQKAYERPNDPASKVTGTTAISEAIVQVLGTSNNSTLSRRIVTNENGQFEITVEPEATYQVSASKPSYFKKSQAVSNKGKIPDAGTNVVTIYTEITLDKIFKNREVVLENIYFDLDKWDIRDDAQPTLNKLVQTLNENPNLKIELGSHTDSRGSDRYNLNLSQKRADSTVSYLVSKGIEARRLVARGYGETQLVNECEDGVNCPDEQHQKNRRSTFRVLSDNYYSNGF